MSSDTTRDAHEPWPIFSQAQGSEVVSKEEKKTPQDHDRSTAQKYSKMQFGALNPKENNVVAPYPFCLHSVLTVAHLQI